MAKDNDDKKKQGGDVSSLLFPVVEAARGREKAFLKSLEKDDRDLSALERLNSANVNASARLYQSHYRNDPWREEHKGMADSPLYSHLPGRLGMRMVTRGLLGASFMAVGSTFTRTYDWHAMEESYKGANAIAHSAETLWRDQHVVHRGMFRIGKAIDATVGRGIQALGRKYYSVGEHEIKYTVNGESVLEKRALSPEEVESYSNRWVTFRGKQNFSKTALDEYDNVFEESRKAYKKSGFEGKFQDWNPSTTGNHKEGFPLRPLMRQFGSTDRLRGTSGQTLGEEIVRVTSDFAMGSAGDALGMELFSYVDPNVKKDWKDEEGIHLGKLAKNVGSSLWTVATYRQMEDWAAALPYVYQMKVHRQVLPRFFEGAKYELDRNTGGSTLKASMEPMSDGTAKVDITGDYTAASALDLQARFMGYNFYTLMFRDMYHHAASKIEELTSHSPKAETTHGHNEFLAHPLESVASGASEAGKYVAKSFVKSMIYMAPAVVPFWAVRIPLDMDRGMILSPDGGLLTARETGKNYEFMPAERPKALDGKAAYNPSLFSSIQGNKEKGADYRPIAVRARNAVSEMAGDEAKSIKAKKFLMQGRNLNLEKGNGIGFDIHDKNFDLSQSRTSLLGRTLGKSVKYFDKLEAGVEGVFNKAVYKPDASGKGTGRLGKGIDNLYKNMGSQEVATVIAHDYVRGAMAYTPYMMAKAETANLYDTPEMDASIYRMIDGATSLNGAEFKAGMRDIGRVITLNPASKVTQAKVYDGRGMAHSKQRDADQRAKGQGELLTTHHEASKLVAKIKKEHEAKQGDIEPSSAPVTNNAQAQADVSEKNDSPDTYVTEKNAWQRLHVSEINRDDSNPPPGATIH